MATPAASRPSKSAKGTPQSAVYNLQNPIVEKFEDHEIVPHCSPEFQKLLPTVFNVHQCSLIIRGINQGIANAIRRAISCELILKQLKMEEFVTNDRFLQRDLILKRIALIPINQSIHLGARFELSAENPDKSIPLDIKSAALVQSGSDTKTRQFNETFTLFTLAPKKSAKMNAIVVEAPQSSTDPADTPPSVAFRGTAIPLDQRPIDQFAPNEKEPHLPYNDTAVYLKSSSLSFPHDFLIKFGTNGNIRTADLLKMTLSSIVSRLERTAKLIPQTINTGEVSVLAIPNETNTIGGIIRCGIFTRYPDIDFACDCDDTQTRAILIKILDKMPLEQQKVMIGEVLNDAITSLKKISEKI
ncbi:MAG: hypothetical protein M0R33_14015 [Methylomonas sp.]|jgi:hypothetical protein|uniref:hypothetical protein n=1 Tax=Methylomonas sp. TaxID=418 RepID=UPI0025F60217|nr:hypothetical protein [Methylomonas sp.]MCK9607552.1 hypothetical protein [Methylomonas sp.]